MSLQNAFGNLALDATLTTGTQKTKIVDASGNVISSTGNAIDINLKTSSITIPVTANAGTNLNTALLALESGGNLSTLAGAITSTVMQSNIKQINGITPLMGNGVTGTGSQRVTIASDNTAFSVNATLSAETTKVIGTINVAASQTIAVTNTGTFAAQATLSAETTKVIGVVRNSDGSGNLLVSAATAATSTLTGYANQLPFGKYNATPPTLTDGQSVVLQVDASGALKVNESALTAGENLTYNKLEVMPKYTYSAVAVADVQIKSGPGILHSITISCNDSAPTAGSIIIYDNTAESGTIVFNFNVTTTYFTPFTVLLDYNMLTGIYCGFTTTGDVNVSMAFL